LGPSSTGGFDGWVMIYLVIRAAEERSGYTTLVVVCTASLLSSAVIEAVVRGRFGLHMGAIWGVGFISE
jgi:hypothetical protein